MMVKAFVFIDALGWKQAERYSFLTDLLPYRRDVEKLLTFLRVQRADEHTAGVDAHHLPGRKVRYGDACLPHQFLRLVVFMYAAEYHPVLTRPIVKDELQEFL